MSNFEVWLIAFGMCCTVIGVIEVLVLKNKRRVFRIQLGLGVLAMLVWTYLQ